MHQHNAAEQGIQTFKSHFISILAGISDDFPINQWNKLIPQTVLTLNLLHQFNVTPNVSAYAYHHGTFNYNRMPLAPMGCAVQFHIKQGRRKTWDENSSNRWYLQTSPEHYRSHCLCQEYKAHSNYRYNLFQTQVSHPTNSYTSRCHSQCISGFDTDNQGISNSKGTAHLEALQQLKRSFEPQQHLVD